MITQLNFFTISNSKYFRSNVYFDEIIKNKYLNLNHRLYNYKNLRVAIKKISSLKKYEKKREIDIVMFPSHALSPILKILRANFVVLDAGWSLHEGEIVSRKKYGILFYRYVLFYLLDFLAAHCAC